VSVTSWELLKKNRMSKIDTLNEELNRIRTIIYGSNQNFLIEQNDDYYSRQDDWNEKYKAIKIPQNLKGGDELAVPKNTKVNYWQPNDSRVQSFFKDWEGSIWAKYIPKEKDLEQVLPDGTARNFFIFEEKKWYYSRIKRIGGNEYGPWKLNWYYDTEGNPYDPKKFAEGLVDDRGFLERAWEWIKNNWKSIAEELLWAVAAVIVGALTGGIGAEAVYGVRAGMVVATILGRAITYRALWRYLGEAGVWTIKGMINIANGKEESGAIDLLFGLLLPAVHGLGINSWGLKVTEEEALSLATKLVGKTEAEVMELLTKSVAEGGLSNADKKIFRQLLELNPQKVTEQTKAVFREINNRLIESGKDPRTVAELSGLVSKESIQALGDYIHARWFRRLPAYFIHDMVAINYFKKIFAAFGLEDEPDMDAFQDAMFKAYQTAPDKNEFIKQTTEIINNSKDSTALINYFEQKGYIDTSKMNIPVLEKIYNIDK